MKLLAMIPALWITAALQQEGPAPKPLKEHELLKKHFEGEWDFEAKFFHDGDQPQTMKGTDVSKIGYGGFWITSEVRGMMFGIPFEGRWTMTWNNLKKKYEGNWIDGFMPFQIVLEGDYDEAKKVYTITADTVDPDTMKPIKERWEITIESDDARTMKFYVKGQDGKEKNNGMISYKRKKKE